MYGLINEAVKTFVLHHHGAAMWTTIHTKAGAPESFAAMSPYDDAITYNLVGAASEELHLPMEQVLRAFGEYWVTNVAVAHYGTIMSRSGQNFVDFVRNLDHMHQRIRVTFPNYTPPSFRVCEVAPDLLQIDYYSERAGLLPLVDGILVALGRHFGEDVAVESIESQPQGLPCSRLMVRHRKSECTAI